MFAVPGYAVLEQIHRGRRSSVFRARALKDQQSVVLKVSPDVSSDPAALVRFRHEHRLGSSILHEHVLRYLALEPCGERVALVEEDFGGRSLAELLAVGPIGLETALDIALKVARGLAEVHALEVIHRAIHPGNILVEPRTGKTKIIDFADATFIRQHAELTRRAQDRTLPLAYISPEQTGRTNLEVDHRTDFYSLGATLHHMLAGRVPFEDGDALALVHAHIARVPTPLCELDHGIPETVSLLVDRLLAKNPEDRYQSAPGLVADLADALRRLREHGCVDPFPLGLADAPERLELPRRLYGRDGERRLLLDSFEHASAGGKLLVLVSGYSGVGKSSLVHEVRRPIVERRGFFLSGKFDALHRNVPYAALRAAFQQLCDELLSESDDELRAWKERILARLGANAALIVEVVPELEKIIGVQPAAPRTGLVESQHRFAVAMQRFVGLLASEQHPVVLFLDDLQWVDPATLHVVRTLLTSPELTHLLVIGAYRDNELDAAHPFALALEELRRTSVPMHELALRDLSEHDVEVLVADALRAPRSQVLPLTRLVFEKTSGNPFFVDEFLRMLAREKLLAFSPALRTWTWDTRKIEALGITANVVALLLERLQKLPEPVQRALRLAACIGDRFALSTLAQASGASMNETRATLEPAIRERFLLPLETTYPFDAPGEATAGPGAPDYRYRFPHDRVRQAAYELTPEAERPALHLGIGRMLLAQTPIAAREERVFEIADQLARGASLVHEPAERLLLAELCLLAGKKARSATAYAEGLSYLRTGLAALPDDAFEGHYDLAYQLHLRATECAYLAGHFDDADKLADALLPRLRSPLERAELYSVRIVLEANRTRYDRSVALGREALAALGIHVPEHPGTLPLLRVLARTQLARFRKRGVDLASLPDLTDERLIAAVSIIEHLFAPAYFMDPKLFFWLVHECLRISLTHGNAPPSSVGYVSYGLLLAAVMGKYEDAEHFGRLGLALADRYAWSERLAKLDVMFGLFIHHFRDHARKSLEYARRAVPEGLESGDIVYASIAAANHAEGAAIVGDPLDDVFRQAEAGERFARPLRHGDVNVMFLLLKQFVRCLRGETDGVASLSGQGVDETDLVADVKAAEARIMLAIYLIWKVELLYLFHRPVEAMELVLEHDETIESMTAGQLRMTEYVFFACLAGVGCLRAGSGSRRTLRRLLARKRKRLAAWAESGPANYLHKHLLVSAELADLEGRADEAATLYDRAIHEAQASGYHQHAALAAELAGRAFERRGSGVIARAYYREARTGYARWGATAKVRALDAAQPDLAPETPPRASSIGESLDLVSVLRASQAISSEMDLGRLLERTMRLIVENAGAERAALIVDAGGELRIEAMLDVRSGALDVLAGQRLDGSGLLPEGLVRFTARTNEAVVLAHAAREGAFMHDAYVRARGAKSLACIPVRLQDRTTGVLFLENELTAGAFTTERLEVLRFLVAQAAISLENARLYESTRTLNQALRASEARLEAFLEGLPVGVFVLEPDGRPSFANRKAREIVDADPALAPADVFARYPMFVAGGDEAYPPARLPLDRALRGETSMVDDVEVRLAERAVPLAMWGTPIRAEDGGVRYAVVAFQDIGPQRAAERERGRLEEQLKHAERLESVGRLAGGVAHDFNNLLTPMLMYSELALRSLPAGSPAHAQISEVLTAAERAAELTRQLLAFGRKEVLETRVLDLDAEVADFLRMLRRLVREDVEIVHHPAPEACLVRADRGQLQRIIMNLGMNGADAMPAGGRLSIETGVTTLLDEDVCARRGVPPGTYVALRVIDTGTGMDARTLQRIFEPFFTTKEPGKGTGLGLPTVHGLVAQHRGHVSVQSEVGVGSSFEVLFPRAQPQAAEARAPEAPPVARPAQSGRTVLVVEDEEAVRLLLVNVLTEDGYHVVATGDPPQALELASELGERLELVISDVVMPKVNGRELVRELTHEHPGLRVLYVSGYPDAALTAEGVLELGVNLLRKPFTADELRRRVRDVLATATRA